MADENFDVMISEKEYHQLKQHQVDNANLQKRLSHTEAQLKASASECITLQQQLVRKDVELAFLVSIL
ncbi:MAG: hypothetical protein KDD45_03335 [Bdellovibrionales bacterium]|nr:hypothetical protein [Bdellovibrionales bacterium]